ncbi:MAG: hypothetical protein CM1200mP33_5680 [Chloroflexota bacterium]|nr:MAG: hypothetical protein CM1200mP33_5680 [Chloroflexota bacterium]
MSFKAREMLDNAGLNETKIIASGSMDEYSINKLKTKIIAQLIFLVLVQTMEFRLISCNGMCIQTS